MVWSISSQVITVGVIFLASWVTSTPSSSCIVLTTSRLSVWYIAGARKHYKGPVSNLQAGSVEQIDQSGEDEKAFPDHHKLEGKLWTEKTTSLFSPHLAVRVYFFPLSTKGNWTPMLPCGFFIRNDTQITVMCIFRDNDDMTLDRLLSWFKFIISRC